MVFRATATLVGKGLKKGAKKVKELERGASTRAGAAGNKGVKIEKNANVGQGYGVTDTTKGAQALTKQRELNLHPKVVSVLQEELVLLPVLELELTVFSKDDKKKDEKSSKADKKETKPTGRFGQGSSKTRNGKANVSKEQLEKTGLTLTAYMNKWNKSGKRPTAAAASKSGTKKRPAIFGKDAKFRPLGGVLARALLGDDEKFGGERGLIDFVRTKKKPVKKQAGGMMKAKRTVNRAAPREEKLAAGRLAAAARASRNTRMGGKEAGPSRARSGAGTGRSISELSDAQKNLLRSVQSTGKKQSTSVIDDLTKKYGNLAARKQRQNLKKKAPRPPGMKMGGMPMKSKMASKGGKMGGKVPPGYKNGGSVGRKKTARGVGAAKRGFGKAMR